MYVIRAHLFLLTSHWRPLGEEQERERERERETESTFSITTILPNPLLNVHTFMTRLSHLLSSALTTLFSTVVYVTLRNLECELGNLIRLERLGSVASSSSFYKWLGFVTFVIGLNLNLHHRFWKSNISLYFVLSFFRPSWNVYTWCTYCSHMKPFRLSIRTAVEK